MPFDDVEVGVSPCRIAERGRIVVVVVFPVNIRPGGNEIFDDFKICIVFCRLMERGLAVFIFRVNIRAVGDECFGAPDAFGSPSRNVHERGGAVIVLRVDVGSQ